VTSPMPGPAPWRLAPRAIAVRLFLTCWMVFGLHFATNTVRELFLALAIGDHFSFRVDEYAKMHPDLFEKPGYGWHIGANPGGSMVAALPYALARPVIDRVVERVNRQRAASGRAEPPGYQSPWPMARAFYAEAWRRGFDVKFGLAAFVMQFLAMAPSTALGVVAMFFALRQIFASDRTALWLSLLYAFGTPVFFRTGYLNHNLMLGHIVFLGFLVLWNPSRAAWPNETTRYVIAGLSGGLAILFDYSGVVLAAGLFFYGLVRAMLRAGGRGLVHNAAWYVAGGIPPILLLWLYQWRSFGHPFYPGQHWMPPVEWIEVGYQGVKGPQLDLLAALAFDYRFGLFVASPLMLLGLLAPFVDRGPERRLPVVETVFVLGSTLALWFFFSGVQYTRLQFNTGIRYLAPIFPFLFLPTAVVLARLPRRVIYFVALLSVLQSWAHAMYRDVERGLGMLEPILRVLSGGFQLPALSVLARMGGQYGDYFAQGVSPLPLFALTAAIIFGIWAPWLDKGRQLMSSSVRGG
jgi:Dolichyl-phosphate-mannose-protein mannosyltransferase